MTNQRGRPPHPDVLTPAEWRVLEQIREGRTNAEIADALDVSVNTVRYHVSNILGKLEVRDREAASRWLGNRRRWGWLAIGWGRAAVIASLSAVALTIAVATTTIGSGSMPRLPQANETGRSTIADREQTAVPEPKATAEAGTTARVAAPFMCRRESEEIQVTLGAPKTYEALTRLTPGQRLDGRAHWIDRDGCVVHAPLGDLEPLFTMLGTPTDEVPTDFKYQCRLSPSDLPPGLKLQSAPVRADETGPERQRMIRADGSPLDEPISFFASCVATGDGYRFELSGAGS